MPTLQNSVSVAANAVSSNQVQGEQFEFLSRPSLLRLYNTGSAIGLNCTLLVGGRTVINDQPISLQNRFPITPDDFMGEAGGVAGERLILTFRNTTAGALTAFWRVEILPVA